MQPAAFPRGTSELALRSASSGTERRAARVAAGVTFAVFLTHSAYYRFLTDDAFIAFRYARNLAAGHGLVFNPGGERVEGFTSLLWVALLGLGQRLGVAPENAALPLSFAASLLLWSSMARFLWQEAPEGRRVASTWCALGLLALARSFAVWTTGGLETRWFETWVVCGTLRLLGEERRLARGERARPLAAWCFAAAVLTRPEGLPLALVAWTAVLVFRRQLGAQRAWLATSLGVMGVATVSLLVLRRLYFDDWLPNTWYAKVDGRLDADIGARHLAAFVLEYGLWAWPPLFVAAALACARRGRGSVPWTLGALVLAHAAYVVSIGGDHFEYRLLDLLLPWLCLLAGVGLATLRLPRVAPGALGALVALGLVELPLRAHLGFPARYAAGFPGHATTLHTETGAYLAEGRGLLSRLPGWSALARLHRKLVFETSLRFVGLRREEHALFLAEAEREAARVQELLEQGLLPRDTHLALDCVGALAYRTDLEVFDRLGLTNREVARSSFVNPDLAAHGKYATLQQAADAGVELWSIDPLRLHWRADDPRLATHLLRFHQRREDISFARVGEYVLLAWAPHGTAAARERFAALPWHSTLERDALVPLLPEVDGTP